MKLLILSRYGRQGASSRLRMMQYIPTLEAAGFKVETAPFFDDAYLTALYGGNGRAAAIPKYYLRRAMQARRRPRPDLIWLEKEVFPWLPWGLERKLLPRGIPIVADYDDAVFHRYDLHARRAVRTVLGQKIDHVMAHAGAVTAGNAYLADRANAAGARHICTVPTVVDTTSYAMKGPHASDDTVRVGWIGTPGTWEECVAPFLPVLEGIMTEAAARLCAVGAGQAAAGANTVEVLEWSEDAEVALIQGMDIGVMPLPDTPWMRGKCGYKLIQYMACGLPVVASPVGVNAEMVEHGVNGFLAMTNDEWRDALTTLARDPALRRRMGRAGREKVEREYSLQVQGPRVAQLLRDVASLTAVG